MGGAPASAEAMRAASDRAQALLTSAIAASESAAALHSVDTAATESARGISRCQALLVSARAIEALRGARGGRNWSAARAALSSLLEPHTPEADDAALPEEDDAAVSRFEGREGGAPERTPPRAREPRAAAEALSAWRELSLRAAAAGIARAALRPGGAPTSGHGYVAATHDEATARPLAWPADDLDAAADAAELALRAVGAKVVDDVFSFVDAPRRAAALPRRPPLAPRPPQEGSARGGSRRRRRARRVAPARVARARATARGARRGECAPRARRDGCQ